VVELPAEADDLQRVPQQSLQQHPALVYGQTPQVRPVFTARRSKTT
jgi:hypothetical protein